MINLTIITDPSSQNLAKKLSSELKIPITKTPEKFALKLKNNHLALEQIDGKNTLTLAIDFTEPKLQKRVSDYSKELLQKAVNDKRNISGKILDATAGLGRDSFILAKSNSFVTLIEQNLIIGKLLENALEKAADLEPIKRMNLVKDNAINFLQKTKEKFEVIYLDPMFPETGKNSKAKQEMQILQNLLENEKDSYSELLELAQKKALHRVVVKRPKNAPYLNNQKPNFSLTGKTIRFDIYLSLP